MAFLTIDETRCKQDGICAAECPRGIITQEDDKSFPQIAEADQTYCMTCGHCEAAVKGEVGMVAGVAGVGAAASTAGARAADAIGQRGDREGQGQPFPGKVRAGQGLGFSAMRDWRFRRQNLNWHFRTHGQSPSGWSRSLKARPGRLCRTGCP